MNNVIISADCVCDLPKELISEKQIQIVPFYITINGFRFQDHTEINSTMIIDYFTEENTTVETTPATIDEYKAHFKKCIQDENTEILHISIAGKKSHAYANACSAARSLKNVYVFDSGSFSHGLALYVLSAAELARNGESVDSILEELRRLNSKTSSTFVLESTQYLANNKRISQSISFLLDLFRIKPAFKINNNTISVKNLYFTSISNAAKKHIKSALNKQKDISNKALYIAFSGCTAEFRQMVYAECQKYIDWKKIYIQDVSASSLCNIGPNSFGLSFFTK